MHSVIKGFPVLVKASYLTLVASQSHCFHTNTDRGEIICDWLRAEKKRVLCRIVMMTGYHSIHLQCLVLINLNITDNVYSCQFPQDFHFHFILPQYETINLFAAGYNKLMAINGFSC